MPGPLRPAHGDDSLQGPEVWEQTSRTAGTLYRHDTWPLRWFTAANCWPTTDDLRRFFLSYRPDKRKVHILLKEGASSLGGWVMRVLLV
jgi:hypothetical protein